MTVKINYEIGDKVWIHGVTSTNNLTEGRIIHYLDLSKKGYPDIQYLIEIPTHIEPLLEIRTWQTISQDSDGPVGALRTLGETLNASNKKLKHMGYSVATNDSNNNEHYDANGPTPEQIMAALENSQSAISHGPLHLSKELLKEQAHKPKRKYYNRNKKRDSKN